MYLISVFEFQERKRISKEMTWGYTRLLPVGTRAFWSPQRTQYFNIIVRLIRQSNNLKKKTVAVLEGELQNVYQL